MNVNCNFCGCLYDSSKGACPTCGGRNSLEDNEDYAERKKVRAEYKAFEENEKKAKEEKHKQRQAELDVAEKKVKSGCVAVIATVVILILVGVAINYLFT